MRENVESRARSAERRRGALQKILNVRGLTVSEAARRADLQSPSAIGNFLAGESMSLSFDTAEPLARSLDISLNELVGDDGWPMIRGRRIYLKGAINGKVSRTLYWPTAKWIEFIVPLDRLYADKSYLLAVESEEMNEIWPSGTALEVVDLENFKEPLRSGDRVIIDRRRGRRIETFCREIVSRDDDPNLCHLTARSSERGMRGRFLPFPWPIAHDGHREAMIGDKDRIQIRAVVVRSIREER